MMTHILVTVDHETSEVTVVRWGACVRCGQPKGTDHDPKCDNRFAGNIHPQDELPVMEEDC
jgi:hypothetical protein